MTPIVMLAATGRWATWHPEQIRDEPPGWTLRVPLASSTGSDGYFYLGDKSKRGNFRSSDQQLVATIAQILGSTLLAHELGRELRDQLRVVE